MIEREISQPISGWQSARGEQLRRWAALSLREILEALEEMEQLGERLRPPHMLAVPSVDPGAAAP